MEWELPVLSKALLPLQTFIWGGGSGRCWQGSHRKLSLTKLCAAVRRAAVEFGLTGKSQPIALASVGAKRRRAMPIARCALPLSAGPRQPSRTRLSWSRRSSPSLSSVFPKRIEKQRQTGRRDGATAHHAAESGIDTGATDPRENPAKRAEHTNVEQISDILVAQLCDATMQVAPALAVTYSAPTLVTASSLHLPSTTRSEKLCRLGTPIRKSRCIHGRRKP